MPGQAIAAINRPVGREKSPERGPKNLGAAQGDVAHPTAYLPKRQSVGSAERPHGVVEQVVHCDRTRQQALFHRIIDDDFQ